MEQKLVEIEKNDKTLDITEDNIKNLIYTIRGKQVMLDSDIAQLYEVETKRVNESVKRNIERFPNEFCFKLNKTECDWLRSQIATLTNHERGKHRKYLPYVFTEQGVAMLSAVLHSDKAIRVSINIMKAFIDMRKFILSNGRVFERLTNIEYKVLELEKVLNELQRNEEIKQRIFFEGQIYDAYSLIIKLIRRAKEKIVIIDNYIDDSILEMLTKKNKNVEAVIITSNKSSITKLDVQKFNKEYPKLEVSTTNRFHDRFIIIDNKELYHCGASFKDLGKKCFAISKMEDINYVDFFKKIIPNY